MKPAPLKLAADIARCWGLNCTQKEKCLRYLARNDIHPHLSFFSPISGEKCTWKITTNDKEK